MANKSSNAPAQNNRRALTVFNDLKLNDTTNTTSTSASRGLQDFPYRADAVVSGKLSAAWNYIDGVLKANIEYGGCTGEARGAGGAHCRPNAQVELTGRSRRKEGTVLTC